MSSNAPRASVSTILPIVILAIVAALGFVWIYRPGPSMEHERQAHGEVLGAMTGLARPVNNKLSAEYSDANGDLLADAPVDASKQLDPAEIVFTYIASDKNAADAAAFAPLGDAISKATGKPTRFLPVTDLDEQLAAMHDGTLHVCAFNTGAVPIAVDAAGFVPVSSLGGDAGPQTYQLKLIASTRLGITTVDRVAGQEITLTEMGSNSGFKAPLVLLNKKFSLMPGRDYAIRYSGGYQQSIDGLVDQTFDIIAVASDVLARAERAGMITPAAYRVLYTSDPFPTACFGYSHALKPELAKQIETVLADFSFVGNSVGAYFEASAQTKLVKMDYAKDFGIVRDIDNAIGFEHKLRKPQPPEPGIEPTTVPAQ